MKSSVRRLTGRAWSSTKVYQEHLGPIGFNWRSCMLTPLSRSCSWPACLWSLLANLYIFGCTGVKACCMLTIFFCICVVLLLCFKYSPSWLLVPQQPGVRFSGQLMFLVQSLYTV